MGMSFATGVEDWPRLVGLTFETEFRWLGEPGLAAWVAKSRLNLLRNMRQTRTSDPR